LTTNQGVGSSNLSGRATHTRQEVFSFQGWKPFLF